MMDDKAVSRDELVGASTPAKPAVMGHAPDADLDLTDEDILDNITGPAARPHERLREALLWALP
ncbi:hypothetical protein E4U42_001803, partial [Claviceps africana]